MNPTWFRVGFAIRVRLKVGVAVEVRVMVRFRVGVGLGFVVLIVPPKHVYDSYLHDGHCWNPVVDERSQESIALNDSLESQT